ncbi:LPS export ABC transporter periplasmic protein LptC [Geobacter sp. 60473]|uniref:LPS export ABC transporter periplasmic protein LptC n=1 Tax=Geobacter sp. 60473 TaxID=3080755 RepID=UPI002B2E561B|nr:LPS export ABC transporter periplasmic protein LptC [Geobacter sp. 60473]
MVKTSKIRHILAVVIILVTLYLVASLAIRLVGGNEKEAGLPTLPRNIDLSLKTLHYAETREGVKKWDLYADRGEYDRQRDVTFLTGVRIVFPGTGKTGEITLRSDKAEYFNATKDVTLTGNIHARSTSGMEFTTGRASYRASRQLVVTDDRVSFRDARFTVEGVGMEFLVPTRTLRILNDVRATIAPAPKD